MARTSRRNNDIEPAHRVLTYSIDADGSHDIDIAKDLSVINRRLYRQGMQYYVESVEVGFIPTAAVSYVHLACLTAGDTWMVHNAWKKAQAAWLKQQRDARANGLQSAKPKWEDFKVSLDDASSTPLTVIAGDDGTCAPDDWVYSKFVWDDDGTEHEPTMNLLGSSDLATGGNGVGLVLEYNRSRAHVDTAPPLFSTLSDSIYAKLHGTDELTDMLVDNMEDDNDAAPYDMDAMVGGSTVADAPWFHGFSISTPANKGIHPGFLAECGLVRIVVSSYAADGSVADIPNGSKIFVKVAPGPYRGVMASPMGQ